MTTSKDPQSSWGQYVLQVMAEHGTNPRQQRARTGIAHTTIYSWLDDIPPKMEGVIQFARGFGRDVEEALRAAGFEASAAHDPATVREALEQVVQLGRQKYARELEYVSEEEAGPIFQYTGQTDIPDHDRALLEEAYRALEAEHRAKHGPHE